MTSTTPRAGTAATEPIAPAGPVTVRLARLAQQVRSRGLTPSESHAATRAVLDWFGATIAGSATAPARILKQAVAHDASGGRARLVPGGRRLAARTAALINATASHTVEMDDIYREGIYHPGSPTVGAALALAEQLDRSGADLLRAVAIGYEVGDRIAETVNPTHYRYWHTTGTIGAIGAAAAAAELLELDAERFAHALATASTMGAGLQQAFRSDAMSKPLHAGHAAETGVLAGLAAQHGYTGALDVLDGESGLGAAMAGSPDWSTTAAHPDAPLKITQATVKNHSCCGHTFAAVDAALRLRTEGLRADQVDSIEVRTYGTAVKVAGIEDPRTDFEAKFSTAYCVAAALVLGSVRLRAFEPPALADPRVRALAARVRLVPDAEMEHDFPGRRRAVVRVVDHAGDTRVSARDTRKGDPDDPLDDAELADKFHDLASPVLGDRAAAQLVAQLWALSTLSRLSDLDPGVTS
ncbi:MmgE/PrpD family protein [Dactylosporangium sp. CA-092794]|uniref:MmgE/PrpD family protein n=1 Tax=Dactylosporangium sp. CA-092794 TaxID=3239929 RepID=UPI003D8B605B